MTVLLCDSNQMQSQLLVSALRRRPELQVYACPMQIGPILQVVEASNPEVVVFSIQRTGDAWTDLAALRRVRLTHPAIGCLVLTDFYDRELVVDAFRSGAKGIFCFSEQPFRMFCRCIHCIHEGQIWANAEQLQYLAEALSFVPSLRVVNAKGGRLLTAREEQVVALVADGLGNRDISQELNISEHTV
ncbi:MAG: response regulator transcription factor [Acidobacteriales bacterium]|nr:response regulator transcription factor [Terriglobales bacterium]